jgi:AcrR family transcriptional regulator
VPPTASSASGATPASDAPAAPAPDGRNLRRDRNRAAVVDALLSLFREGVLSPGAEEIAERAGISVRSVFRYFDDREAMARSAIALQAEFLAPLFPVDATPDMPLPERIDSFVASRVRLLEGMGEVGRVARYRAARQPVLLAELARIRRVLRRQVADLFAAELDDLPAAARVSALAAADVVMSWESFDLMRNDQGLSRDDAVATMATTLARLLEPGDERDR